MTGRLKAGPRTHCCVKGCEKSWPLKPGDEHIQTMCSKHVRNAPPVWRDRYRKIRRAINSENRKIHPDPVRLDQLHRIHSAMWNRIAEWSGRTGAIEGAPPELADLGLL